MELNFFIPPGRLQVDVRQKEEIGVIVENVHATSPTKGKLCVGDIIVGINQVPVADIPTLTNLLHLTGASNRLITVRRKVMKENAPNHTFVSTTNVGRAGTPLAVTSNVAVGTVISTEADKDEGNIYGFASVLNVTTFQEQGCIQELKKLCLDKCPPAHKADLETVLSGKTKRPAGFYLQSRMVNLPLEIVEVLHQQSRVAW